MKILSWNCHYGFTTKKAEAVEEYNAGILVLPECRKMDMEISGYAENRRDWYGDRREVENLNLSETVKLERDLGIGIFWKDGITITQLPEWENVLSKDSNFRYLVPYRVEGAFDPFTLIAVWTKNKTGPGDPLDYVQKAHAAIERYKDMGLLNGRVILIGDFNSNEKWDKDYREGWGHTALVKRLEEAGIKNCSSGGQNDTYYYYRNGKEFSVVDDYCFASTGLAECAEFSVPGPDEWVSENGHKLWRGLSDHCPIIVDFNF